MVKVVFVIAVLGLTIFALIDLFQVPREEVRGGSRFLWILAILLVPLIGAGAWLWLGRTPGDSGPGLLPPDDDPDFLRGLS